MWKIIIALSCTISIAAASCYGIIHGKFAFEKLTSQTLTFHDLHVDDVYYSSCKEALEDYDGKACSGVYNIKPDNLPPIQVSILYSCVIYSAAKQERKLRIYH